MQIARPLVNEDHESRKTVSSLQLSGQALGWFVLAEPLPGPADPETH